MDSGRMALRFGVFFFALLSEASLQAGECQGFTVFPSDSKPYGRSLGGWGAEWWKWALSLPTTGHPVSDDTGEFAHAGQPYTGGDPTSCRLDQGPVFFLAGTRGGGKVVRTCTIPCGKALFFPLLNVVGWGAPECENCPRCMQEVDAFWKSGKIEILECAIDGESVPDLQKYDAASPECFCVILPEDSPFGQPGKYDVAVSAGYWLMVAPLCPGPHTIRFRAKTIGSPGLDVTYNLTVEPCLFRRGDAAGDGQYDLADPIRILNYMFAGGRLSCLASADLDDDGQILLNDPIYLLTYLFSIGPQPALPFPDCGLDPSPGDALGCESYPCPP